MDFSFAVVRIVAKCIFPGMAEELAIQGWLVRVQTVGAVHPIAFDFAVGRNATQYAIAAVLSHLRSVTRTR